MAKIELDLEVYHFVMKDTKDSNTSVIRPKDFALYIQSGKKYRAPISKKNFAAFVEKVTYIVLRGKWDHTKPNFLVLLVSRKGNYWL